MLFLKKKWVLVFSFMYLVSVDPMDRSKEVDKKLDFVKEKSQNS